MPLRPIVCLFLPHSQSVRLSVSHRTSARTQPGGFPLKLNIGVSYNKSVVINPHLAKIISKYPVLYMKCYQAFRIKKGAETLCARAAMLSHTINLLDCYFFKSPG